MKIYCKAYNPGWHTKDTAWWDKAEEPEVHPRTHLVQGEDREPIWPKERTDYGRSPRSFTHVLHWDIHFPVTTHTSNTF